ncbi:hypothetical protein CA606_11345 [Caulobacter vibrioides]|uniref:AbrB/MazE/SpoVT family DNA-binding domain-containing protein n=1 Tax=Caulobacter vibrioides TaxID=155892 RepID=A0A290MLD8_CAUVI|nr:hypothetical protein [Caulobacter vibrioides]ATC32876.1 hypothetical protein CA606_11345 [Caulobacter vibrioides]
MSPELEKTLAGCKTVAAKIRALDSAGYPRAEIARLLGKRYQHVRNVLEEPKTAPYSAAPAPDGMAEGDAGVFVHDRSNTYRLEVRNGTVTLPPEVLAALNVGSNGVVIADLGEDTFTLINGMTALKRVQERMKQFWPSDRSIVDDFIADKRREAELENRQAVEPLAQRRHDD